jgi:hypothetical protein
MQFGLCKGLIDAGLVGTEGAAALQQQGNALEGRPFGYDMTFPARAPVSRHKKRLLHRGERKANVSTAAGDALPPCRLFETAGKRRAIG